MDSPLSSLKRWVWIALGRIIWLIIVIALTALHELGWIHRDISVGNILVEGQNGPAKITDLEFCKRIDASGPPHDGRTVRVLLRLGWTHY